MVFVYAALAPTLLHTRATKVGCVCTLAMGGGWRHSDSFATKPASLSIGSSRDSSTCECSPPSVHWQRQHMAMGSTKHIAYPPPPDPSCKLLAAVALSVLLVVVCFHKDVAAEVVDATVDGACKHALVSNPHTTSPLAQSCLRHASLPRGDGERRVRVDAQYTNNHTDATRPSRHGKGL